LKAIDIINFINEDKFSKYTLRQIYDELGPEDFAEYLKDMVAKILKGIDILTNLRFRSFNTEVGDVSMLFDNVMEEYVDEVWLHYILKHNELFIDCSVSSNRYNEKEESIKFRGNLVNLISYLKPALIELVNHNTLVKYRKQLVKEYEDGES
jgi:hypothetical protein